jgi:hypothetical protein
MPPVVPVEFSQAGAPRVSRVPEQSKEGWKEMQIIKSSGKSRFTTTYCDECMNNADVVIEVGEPNEEESSTARLCRPCFEKAEKMWQEHDKALIEKE